jgi:hypothetical protein
MFVVMMSFILFISMPLVRSLLEQRFRPDISHGKCYFINISNLLFEVDQQFLLEIVTSWMFAYLRH